MTKDEFLKEMTEVLQTEGEISFDTVLADMPEWDSLSVMATMAFLGQNFNVKTSLQDYKKLHTLGDIAQLAGLK